MIEIKRRQGLTSAEVEQSRQQHGNNVITPPKDVSPWAMLAEKFRDPIIRILVVAAIFSIIIGVVQNNYTESVGIVCAIILATCVGFWFEWDAHCRFRRLNQVNDDVPVKVLRDGVISSVPRRDVVQGDVVILENGETVPADGELFETVSLQVDESTLTGEPVCSKWADEAKFDPHATYPSNMLLRGTSVVDGYGRMVVTAVGDRSEAGRVTEQATVKNSEPTPLERQLEQLSKWIGRIGIWVSVAVFLVMVVKAFWLEGLLSAEPMDIAKEVLHIFMVSVALIVMAVPEGLPMSITLSLAMSMRRMLKTNNLVRKMHACETMGAVTVICTDKTGTLTRNRMSVEQLIPCEPYTNEEFAESVAANSTAFLDPEGKALGNPTEGALLRQIHDWGMDYEALRRGVQVVDRITFSTERKYMATLVVTASGRRMLYVKGAPEIVLAMCRPSGQEEEIGRRLAEFQQRAMRTLGFAWVETEAKTCDEALKNSELRFVAVAAISDPVRTEVPAAVQRCLDAGIQVKIVTGDTPTTACEIARRIGLWHDESDGERNIMTGVEFAAMSDKELLTRVGDLKILSRARPLDKQRLVRLLQQRGEVVAVTGDGTNDAPALNSADVGLSMGSGTSVAKDASDITLIDDSFSSIATAVMWGRSLYRNIQRFLIFQLTVNVVAILVCFIGVLAEADMPLTVVQILWVNIIMDTFAAMAMASLPPNPEVMKDKPRRTNEPILTPGMKRNILLPAGVMTVMLLGLLFRWCDEAGNLDPLHITLFFTVFVFCQFWNMFNARAYELHRFVLGNLHGCREFFIILTAVGVGQFFIVEFGGEVFRTIPLSWQAWVTVIASTSLLAVGGEALRAIRRRMLN